ncbi:hypothetical protein PHYPSEUDO_014633 [Phytophthora pseudosyringae]|uniref:Uncharacterized protein n=1 Tax=Phytophthora pseudosyringae TaxID=221518 RepID=A0A8T1V516_9STRA|nr:hypothetical protein PHYPSEUDO_014633 [Phytophthora pseudosyringae]
MKTRSKDRDDDVEQVVNEEPVAATQQKPPARQVSGVESSAADSQTVRTVAVDEELTQQEYAEALQMPEMTTIAAALQQLAIMVEGMQPSNDNTEDCEQQQLGKPRDEEANDRQQGPVIHDEGAEAGVRQLTATEAGTGTAATTQPAISAGNEPTAPSTQLAAVATALQQITTMIARVQTPATEAQQLEGVEDDGREVHHGDEQQVPRREVRDDTPPAPQRHHDQGGHRVPG